MRERVGRSVLFTTGSVRALICASHAAPQLGEIQHDRRQSGMHVTCAKPWAEFGEELLDICARLPCRIRRGRWNALALLFADAEIRPDKDVNGRMLDPICGQLFEIEERHLVYHGVGVAAGGGEEPVDMAPTVPTP